MAATLPVQREGNSQEATKRSSRRQWSVHGVLALYNGLGPTVLRTFPATGALFVAYEGTKTLLHDLMD